MAYSTSAGPARVAASAHTSTTRAAIDLRREWDQHANPRSALDAFLAENGRFEVDREINDKLLITDAPDGYLRCIKD